MSTYKKIPFSVSDTLLHVKDSQDTEEVLFPFTRYKNVLNAPRIVNDANAGVGAPFSLLKTDTEVVSISELRELIPDII